MIAYIFSTKRIDIHEDNPPFMDPITTIGFLILVPMTVWSVYALLFHLGVSETFK